MAKTIVCPVCGYPDLEAGASGGVPLFEICPSCGFQFGVTDDDLEYSYAQWRELWVDKGMPWSVSGMTRPDGWNPHEQLEDLLRDD